MINHRKNEKNAIVVTMPEIGSMESSRRRTLSYSIRMQALHLISRYMRFAVFADIAHDASVVT